MREQLKLQGKPPITIMGVDEISAQKGHRSVLETKEMYLTIIILDVVRIAVLIAFKHHYTLSSKSS
jgi:hypothetical protein